MNTKIIKKISFFTDFNFELFFYYWQILHLKPTILEAATLVLPWDEIESPSHWLQQCALPLSYQGFKFLYYNIINLK